MFDSLYLNNFNNNFLGMRMNSFNFNNPFASNFSNSFQFLDMNYNSLFNSGFNSNFNSGFNTPMPMFQMSNSNFFNTGSFNMPMFNMPNMFNIFNTKFKTNSYKTGFDTKTDLAALKDVYNPEISGKLASIASETAAKKDTIGWCYGGVKDSLLKAGLTKSRLSGDPAYLARDLLRKNKNFKEVKIDKEDLTKLPPGCVIVWQPYMGKNKENKDVWHESGHIAITLGKIEHNGKIVAGEASDHIQGLLIGKSYSVFVPTGLSKTA